MIGRPPPCRRLAVALQDGRRAALTAPTLDGADVALQAREKHLHRGPTPLVFRPSTGGVKPSDAPRSIAQQSASVGLFRGRRSRSANKWLRPAAGLSRL